MSKNEAFSPIGASQKRISDFVNSQKEWISNALQKQKERNKKYVGLSDQQIAQLKVSAKEYFKEKTEQFASIMG